MSNQTAEQTEPLSLSRRAARRLRIGTAALLDFALPPVCPICNGPLTAPPDEAPACAGCIGQLPAVGEYCRRCSAPLGPNLRSEEGCHHCRGDRLAVEATFAVGEYRDLLRAATLRAKSPGGEAAAAWLVERLWTFRGDELLALPIDLVTAVPQHWTRRFLGPHNTAELIGRRLASRLKRPFDGSIIRKIRRTPRQTDLSPSERRKNLRAAFQAGGTAHGARILLCDDVMTTGTTAHRAARALRRAGARTVWAAVIARGLGR